MSDINELKTLYEDCIQELIAADIYVYPKPAIHFYDSRYNHGSCTNSTIFIDRALFILNTDIKNKDTIIHELLHSVAGVNTGHGKQWKQLCDQMRNKYPVYELSKDGKVDVILSMQAEKLRDELHINNPLPDNINYPENYETTQEFVSRLKAKTVCGR